MLGRRDDLAAHGRGRPDGRSGPDRARALGLLAALALAGGLGACRHDPVPQGIIDELPEESGEPSAAHRPGEPCLACHSAYEGAEPLMAVGGTVYKRAGDEMVPAPRVLVVVVDSNGDSRKACTNQAGNFFVPKDKWPDLAFPLTVRAGNRVMRSLVGRDGSCATCHRPPDENSLDPVTGAARDSAGVVEVDEGSEDPSCGGGS